MDFGEFINFLNQTSELFINNKIVKSRIIQCISKNQFRQSIESINLILRTFMKYLSYCMMQLFFSPLFFNHNPSVTLYILLQKIK